MLKNALSIQAGATEVKAPRLRQISGVDSSNMRLVPAHKIPVVILNSRRDEDLDKLVCVVLGRARMPLGDPGDAAIRIDDVNGRLGNVKRQT